MSLKMKQKPKKPVRCVNQKRVNYLDEDQAYSLKALVDKNIPVEMHIYPEGGHGFTSAIGNDHLNSWTQRFLDWLKWLNREDMSK